MSTLETALIIREGDPPEWWESDAPEGSVDYQTLLWKFIHHLVMTGQVGGAEFDGPAAKGFTAEEWTEIARQFMRSYPRS